MIPLSQISPQTQNLLKLMPAAECNASADQPNYAGSGAVKFNDDAFNTRTDWYATDKLHVFGRYSFADFRIASPGDYGLARRPRSRPGRRTSALRRGIEFAQPQRRRRDSTTCAADPFHRFSVRLVPLSGFRGRRTVWHEPAEDAGIPG